MLRTPLGLRVVPDPKRGLKQQIREAAALGARGVLLDAAGDLHPERLTETGRREFRHLLRSAEVALIGLNLPTRRPFDSDDQLDDRLDRADRAFAMAFELGTRLVTARVGAVPAEEDEARRTIFDHALVMLGRRAEHRGVRFALETGDEPGDGLRSFLDSRDDAGILAASVDPGRLLRSGHDPVAAVRALGDRVAHAFARDATGLDGDEARFGHPGGFGFSPGSLDWEEYLGALEEVNYAGFLTVWPPPGRPIGDSFARLSARFAAL